MLNVRSQKTTNKKCDFIIYSCQMQNAFWHLSNLTKTQSLFFKVTKMYSPFWILSSIGHSTSLKHKYTMFQKAIHTMYVPSDIFFWYYLHRYYMILNTFYVSTIWQFSELQIMLDCEHCYTSKGGNLLCNFLMKMQNEVHQDAK